MGRSWDSSGVAFSKDLWSSVYQKLKPGGQVKVFSATRTYHRLAKVLEDVGFQDLSLEAWGYGCLSEDSEILTSKGWVRGLDLEGGEEIACWDPETEKVTHHTAVEITKASFSGDMVSICNSQTDQLLTPNHRVYFKQKGGEAWGVKGAALLAGASFQLPLQGVTGFSNGQAKPSETSITAEDLSFVPYVGRVWCVQVPTGAFVGRRNGQVFITGNSGFPKNLNISKAMDKHLKVKREDPETPASEAGEFWEGYGTAVRPSWEPFLVGTKPCGSPD